MPSHRFLAWAHAALFALAAAPTRGATQEVYVWQRRAGPELAAALEAARPLADGFAFLAGEIAWRGGAAEVVRPALDFAALARLGKPVALVLRIGPHPGPYTSEAAATKTVLALAETLLADARAAGLAPAELQIDFDCAESKLAGYRAWLGALRRAAGDTPLVFTALPAWLRHETEFRALAAAADGFILQVHSLEKPAGPDAPFTLCDPARALAWARQAAGAGRPFRVALPTYGYLLAFDAQGRFFALAAEGAPPDWPAGTQVRVMRADAPAMAALARALRTQPPPHCTGVIWFRLPVSGDRLNWDALTLHVILRGELPVPRLAVSVAWPERGLAEITLENTGQTGEPPPPRIRLAWPAGVRPLAADGLAGARLEQNLSQSQAIILNAAGPSAVFLAPGQRVKLAWLRFADATDLTATIAPAP